ncbi:MAG: CoA ester lyase [Armatimonadota bacterium]|nr:CoA ester lyase [Armatimonadota bacterium]MDR7428206.1 CoA ester lyase [Armatimonadota bacterium]MDR7464396.1 CoA ester lyase [Armatimonadota bacterium]MDR7470734.1 CoA ester lyase [Armatimonadota bacterium]MDR7475771.1 CoA ester lyase [Armatimonadota bacterium]
MPPLRSVLFVPGDQPQMQAKARTLPADAIVLDLEDAVAPAHKAAARLQVHRALEEGFPERLAVFVRPNAAASGLLREDLEAVLHPRASGLMLPKVAGPEEVREVDAWLGALEPQRGIAVGALRLLVIVETPRAVLEAFAIARASPRVVGLAFGADDLAAAMGLARTVAPADLRYPRAQVALAAHAAGVEAVDVVYTTVEDLGGFRREAEEARALGYTGKQVIHPRQIELANLIFSPSPQEVAWARRVIEAYEAAPRGAIMVEGRMVDAPVVRQAWRILERAREGEARG